MFRLCIDILLVMLFLNLPGAPDTDVLDTVENAPLARLVHDAETIVLAVALPTSGEPASQGNLTRPKRKALDLGAEIDRVTGQQSDFQNRNTAVLQAAKFQVIETIKGSARLELFMPGRLSDDVEIASDLNDFDGHSDPLFWSSLSIGARAETDVIIPGQTYLLFPRTHHAKSRELILSDADLWLQFVREQMSISEP